MVLGIDQDKDAIIDLYRLKPEELDEFLSVFVNFEGRTSEVFPRLSTETYQRAMALRVFLKRLLHYGNHAEQYFQAEGKALNWKSFYYNIMNCLIEIDDDFNNYTVGDAILLGGIDGINTAVAQIDQFIYDEFEKVNANTSEESDEEEIEDDEEYDILFEFEEELQSLPPQGVDNEEDIDKDN